MASIEAISSQTTAANSSMISIASGVSIQVFASAEFKSPQEGVSVQCTPDSGSTWYTVKDIQWKGKFLSKGITRNSITGPGDFRLVKSQTGEAIAVYYDS